MAAIDYADIRDQLASAIAGDARTSAARVYVEEEPQFGIADAQTVVAIFTNARTAPDGEQPIAAGKRTRQWIDMLLVVALFNMESYRKACDMRDDYLGALELVLMDNRTIGGTVATAWITGGEFYSARDPSGSGAFMAVAEVNLRCEATSIV